MKPRFRSKLKPSRPESTINGLQSVFEGDGINRPMASEAFLVPACRKEDGTWDTYPEGRKNIFIPDIWAEAAIRPDFALALSNVQAALEAYGKEKGVL